MSKEKRKRDKEMRRLYDERAKKKIYDLHIAYRSHTLVREYEKSLV